MTLLVRMIGARRALELGTFTGYSAICIARGLAEGGTLIACELEQERADQARANFGAAGVSDRIDVRVGPAAETLAELRDDGAEPFDFAFIDADKASYPGYYETCLELLRPGGLIVLDNMLRGGDVVDPSADDEGTRAISRSQRADPGRRAGRDRDARRRRRDHPRAEAMTRDPMKVGIVVQVDRERPGRRCPADPLGARRARPRDVRPRPPGLGPAGAAGGRGRAGSRLGSARRHPGNDPRDPPRRVRGVGARQLARRDPLRRELPVRRGPLRFASAGHPHDRAVRLGVLRGRARRAARGAYETIYSMTLAEQERYAGMGIESPYVQWGIHPELLGADPLRAGRQTGREAESAGASCASTSRAASSVGASRFAR